MTKYNLSEEQKGLIRVLHEEGATLKELSENYNVSIHFIQAITQGYNSTTEYHKDLAIKCGAKSLKDYKNKKVNENGFKSMHDYIINSLEKRGFNSSAEYQNYLASKRGKTSGEYQKELRENSKNKLENKKLVEIIKTKLEKLGKSKVDIARTLNIPASTFIGISIGDSYPSENLLEKILIGLNISRDELKVN